MNKNAYKVLLVQSSHKCTDIIKHWLEDKVELVAVSDNVKAEKQISLYHWDLVIIDITAETINDLDVTLVIKEKKPYTSVLILTKNIKVDFLLRAIRNHADDLMFKPLNKREFTDKVFSLSETSRKKRDKEKKVILAIGAHPDDVELGCAGVLAKSRSEGAEVNILTLSLGEVGGDALIRKKEAELAAECLGANLYLGQLLDTKLMNSSKTIKFITDIINEVKPTHLYTHSLYDTHQDHRNVYHATLPACRHLANVFSYLSPSTTCDFKPNLFVTIDEFIETKLEALACFSSQVQTRPYLKPDVILATARYWGRYMNYQLVEPMEAIKFV